METTLAKTDSSRGLALVTRANKYIAASVAENTKRGYTSDFRLFAAWCKDNGVPSLPAAPVTVAGYFGYMADSLNEDGSHKYRPSTIDRARAAIHMAHVAAKVADPTTDADVKKALQGIRRSLGTAKTKKAPALSVDVQAMVTRLPDSNSGVRDRAIILVGFAGAFRRSELAGVAVEHIEHTAEGVKILLPKSKTDQEGAGRVVGIKRGRNPETCPVRALAAWIAAAGITSGPVFRRVDRHSRIMEPITPQSIALVIKRAATAAGLDSALYSGHSLRAGCVTQGALNGASVTNIMRQTGHKSSDTVQGYIRIANVFKHNVSGMLGL